MSNISDTKKQSNFFQKPEVSFWIAIIIPLLGVAVSWGVFTNRIENVEKSVAKLETISTLQITTTQEIQIRLAEIQKDLSHIREALDGR